MSAPAVAAAEAALARAEANARAASLAACDARRALSLARREAAEEAKRAARRRVDNARRKAKALAASIGVEIEQHTDLDSRPWFVSHPAFEDTPDDPHEGDHYVHCWEDVLIRVQDYEAALAARATPA